MKRPKLVAEALRGAFDVGRPESEAVTAKLYGFEGWAQLSSAVARAAGRADPVDEACDARTALARRQHQAETLASHLGLEPTEAKMAVSLLGPTSSRGKPSLRRLGERMMQGHPGEEVAHFIEFLMEERGLPPDAELLGPRGEEPAEREIHSERWLRMLARDFGWKINAAQPSAQGSGAVIGWVAAKRGRSVPIFLSGRRFDPADVADVAVEDLRRAIGGENDAAFLLFDHPLAWGNRGAEALGVVYGGMLLHMGDWSHFVLRPKAGWYDAVHQHGMMDDGVPSPAFVAEFGFRGALDRARAMEAELVSREADEVGPIEIRTPSGWSRPEFDNFVLRAAELLRARVEAEAGDGGEEEGTEVAPGRELGRPHAQARGREGSQRVGVEHPRLVPGAAEGHRSTEPVPIASADIHPSRWMRAVPFARKAMQLASRNSPGGEMSEDATFAMFNLIADAANAAPRPTGTPPPDPKDVVGRDFELVRQVVSFGLGGRNVFAMGRNLVAMLDKTDLKSANERNELSGTLVGDLAMPFNSFYIAFEGGLDVALPGPANRVDGAYLSGGADTGIMVTLTSRTEEPCVWPSLPEPSVTVYIDTSKPSLDLNTAIDRSVADALGQLRTMGPDGRSPNCAWDDVRKWSERYAGRLKEGVDTGRSAVSMALNALCYINAVSEGGDEVFGYPADAPGDLVNRAFAGSGKQRQRARAALLEGGYLVVRMRGQTVGQEFRDDMVPRHRTGRTVAPHWRRGHYRHYRREDGTVYIRRHIRPTPVNLELYDPLTAPGRIYVPEPRGK